MPFLRFLGSRLISLPVTLLIITATLYGFVMLTPPETRATLYLPSNLPIRLTEDQVQQLIDRAIEEHHLRDPYPVQYFEWIKSLIQGKWGYSPLMRGDVLAALLRRTPVTLELTFYSLLLVLPLGLLFGVIAGSHRNRRADYNFRAVAFISLSLPQFIVAIILMAIFYVGLRWFPIERISYSFADAIKAQDFQNYTGFLTIDGLFNGRADISFDALRHLVLPVITLSLLHWATLGRIARATIIDEMPKEYMIAAHARGLPERKVVWNHAFPNVLSPVLTSTALSAAALVTGVYVVELIYNFNGISELIVIGIEGVPDVALILGFAIYSVILVLLIMLIVDILQVLVNPLLRSGVQDR